MKNLKAPKSNLDRHVKNIKVELIEPKYKDDSKIFKINDSKFLKWEIKLKAEEGYVIPIKFHVEYPREESIVGL